MENSCICSIRSIYKAISASEKRLEMDFGVNINELMLLCNLSEQDLLTSGEIAKQLDLTSSNASKVIAAMEKCGNVERHMCEDDKRCMRFSITHKGKELLSHINCDSFKVPDNSQHPT